MLRVMAVFSLVGSIGVNAGDVYKAIGRTDILAKLGDPRAGGAGPGPDRRRPPRRDRRRRLGPCRRGPGRHLGPALSSPAGSSAAGFRRHLPPDGPVADRRGRPGCCGRCRSCGSPPGWCRWCSLLLTALAGAAAYAVGAATAPTGGAILRIAAWLGTEAPQQGGAVIGDRTPPRRRSRKTAAPPDRLRVLYLIDSLGHGGAEHLLVAYLPAPRRRAGVDPRAWCALQDRDGNPLAARPRGLGIPVADLGIQRLRQRGAYCPGRATTIAPSGPTWSTPSWSSPTSSGRLAAPRLGDPLGGTLHTLDTPRPRTRDDCRFRLMAWSLRRYAHRVIAVSESARAPPPRARPAAARTGHHAPQRHRHSAHSAGRRRHPGGGRAELGIPRSDAAVAGDRGGAARAQGDRPHAGGPARRASPPFPTPTTSSSATVPTAGRPGGESPPRPASQTG